MAGEDNENKGYCRAMKNIAADDRPREKALKYGFGALSQAELLAILIGSGTPGESVVELAQRMLQWCDNRLVPLGQKTIGDLKRNFKGIGDAKAITILSAIELAKRYSSEDFVAPQITDSTKAYNLMKFQIGYLTHEEFWVVALNTAKRVIARVRIGQGGTSSTSADPKMIMKVAVDNLANSIIVFHNHPSGNLRPSLQDDNLTHKLVEAGKLLDIPVDDHIIVCANGYYSYAGQGLLV